MTTSPASRPVSRRATAECRLYPSVAAIAGDEGAADAAEGSADADCEVGAGDGRRHRTGLPAPDVRRHVCAGNP